MPAIENPLIQAIPAPDALRDRLAQLALERALLKALLRLSQRKEQVHMRGLAEQREVRNVG
jgi:hypothetical protein